MTIATLLFALITATNASETGGPIVLDFQASWCGPCREIRGAVEDLARSGYPIKEVDVDESPELAAKYKIKQVPTFVVVSGSGRELGRTSSVDRAAALYREAKAKARTQHAQDDDDDRDTQDQVADNPRPRARRASDGNASSPNPYPWETAVRIRIDTGHGLVGFGSGTVIYSSTSETIILTCAHIFKLEGRRQAKPAQFPGRITVDLFDGKLSSTHPRQVHYANESYPGEAIDYDFALDVGLIRIRPGKRLPASRVVPPYWQPKERMSMHTVGCSEGRDATAWSTIILNPQMRGALTGHDGYEAIECQTAPTQGRSGGGLYTDNGYVAGVCDFAEPRGNHGLYAAPSSIYKVLDRNNLTALYDPRKSLPDTLVADRKSPARRRGPAAIARGQSPDHDDSPDVTIPPPQLLGISLPGEDDDARPRAKSRRTAWRAAPKGEVAHDHSAADTALADTIGEEQLSSGSEMTSDPENAAAPAGLLKVRSPNKWRPVKSKTPDSAPARN
jgi:thiol-disulfide isomerase/thioredoxin